MKIKQLERVGMGVFPTPFEALPRLHAELGGPDLYVKRDDLTGIALGGNKVRQLDYILVKAKKMKADYVITTCGIQSNWSRQTVALATKMGLKSLLVLRTAQFKSKPKVYDGNILLDHIMGAKIRVIRMKISEDPTPILEEEAEKLRRKGHNPLVLGPSASVSSVAAAAYAVRVHGDGGSGRGCRSSTGCDVRRSGFGRNPGGADTRDEGDGPQDEDYRDKRGRLSYEEGYPCRTEIL